MAEKFICNSPVTQPAGDTLIPGFTATTSVLFAEKPVLAPSVVVMLPETGGL